MFTLTELQKIISEKISSLNFDKTPSGLYAPIEYTLSSGGKRIRPALVLAACNMFSENIEKALPVALAFEIFHNFTLLHDDIMDNSPIRRNKETVHKKWNVNTAILSGDAMMIEAYKLLSDLSAELLKKVLKLFNDTASEVCEGQQYDMDFENRDDVKETEYIQMIKLKTSVLIAAALKAGAMVGGASEKDADLLYEFGLNIGLAFQIQDDLLDTYGDTAVFGKKTGNDILTGKKTFLLIKALQKADAKTGKKLLYLIKNQNTDNEDKIGSVIKIYNNSDIKRTAENKINEYYQEAVNKLDEVACDDSAKNELLSFASQIMKREK
jgi:geranylgeranyl diphosphate synthase, type II